MTYPIITAAEAHEQGDTPWTLLNIARFNERIATKEKSDSHGAIALAVRQLAAELARMLGVGIRRQGGKSANDNRRQQYKRAA